MDYPGPSAKLIPYKDQDGQLLDGVDGNARVVFNPRAGSPLYTFTISGTFTSATLKACHKGKDEAFAIVKDFTGEEAISIPYMPFYRLDVVGGVGVYASYHVSMPRD